MAARGAHLPLLLILAGCAQQALVSPEAETQELTRADDQAYAETSLVDREGPVFALAKGRAWREKDTLVLTTDIGRRIRLTDQADCKKPSVTDCASYEMVAWLPSHHVFVVLESYYEYYDYLLVDTHTGSRQVIDDLPRYSPDGAHLATFRNDEMNGGGIDVWSVRSDSLVHEWHVDDFAKFVRWQGGDVIEIGLFPEGEYAPDAKTRPATVVQGPKGWQLREGADMVKARP
jgi:hypothetical protein